MSKYANEIRNAVLIIHGEKAHSCYFSKDAYKMLKGDNKELMIIPDAVHTDLYDRLDVLPFDKIQVLFFYKSNTCFFYLQKVSFTLIISFVS